jgi:hypothetical protein
MQAALRQAGVRMTERTASQGRKCMGEEVPDARQQAE